MNDEEFRAMLNLVMCCDPWPIGNDDGYNEETVKFLLLRESVKRNYPNWIDAYHNFEASQ